MYIALEAGVESFKEFEQAIVETCRATEKPVIIAIDDINKAYGVPPTISGIGSVLTFLQTLAVHNVAKVIYCSSEPSVASDMLLGELLLFYP